MKTSSRYSPEVRVRAVRLVLEHEVDYPPQWSATRVWLTTLDDILRRWFVRQTVRERFTCRDCETIFEPPTPFHLIPRGRIGASLLAMCCCPRKIGQVRLSGLPG